jgi:hypothetical protein
VGNGADDWVREGAHVASFRDLRIRDQVPDGLYRGGDHDVLGAPGQ